MLRFILPFLVSSSALIATAEAAESCDAFTSERNTIIDGDTAYVLTNKALEKWSVASRTMQNTWALTSDSAPLDRAYAAVSLGDKIFIANGRSGLVVFDKNRQAVSARIKLANSNGRLESSARGVAVHGDRVFVALDNYSITPKDKPQAFAGLAIVDGESLEVVKELSGFGPGVTSIAVDGSSLFASFGGIPIWQYKIEAIEGAEGVLPEPAKRVWNFPEQGHPTGAALTDGETYTTCFSYRDPAHHLYQKKLVKFSYAELGFEL